MKCLVLLLACVSACVDTPPLHEPVVEQSRVEVFVLPETRRAQTDLLIVVDDTRAMTPYQEQLATLPGRFARRLEWYTQRWIDLRLAVATNDGRLRRLPGATTPWLATAYDFDYTRRTNYSGTLADQLAALMNVGANGDGPSQPLEAARRALETGSELVRDRSGLMVVTVGASDDASPLAISEYIQWTQRVIDGTWRSDVLLSGIYPTGAPRLDQYYKAMSPFSIITSFDAGYYEQAIPWVPGDSWVGGFACLNADDRDPSTPEYDHECLLVALVGGHWRAVPECAPERRIERIEPGLDPSEPIAPCWWVRETATECVTRDRVGRALALSGYTMTQHPELRFECVTR
ncbi:MAG TPA: hypothetical protein VIV11_27045 [Kofleriaceae bacterium]